MQSTSFDITILGYKTIVNDYDGKIIEEILSKETIVVDLNKIFFCFPKKNW